MLANRGIKSLPELLKPKYLNLEMLVNRGAEVYLKLLTFQYVMLKKLVNRGVRSIPEIANTPIYNSREARK